MNNASKKTKHGWRRDDLEVVVKTTTNLPGSCAGVAGCGCGCSCGCGCGGPVVGKQTKLGTSVVVVVVMVGNSKPHNANNRVVDTMDPMVE